MGVHRLLRASGWFAATAVVVVVVALIGGDGHAAVGDSDPGAAVRFAVALVRLVADASGALCVGALVFAAFLAVPQQSGVLAVDGYAALRAAGRAATAWCAAATAMVPLDIADASGQRLSEVDTGLFAALDTPKAWAVTAILALVVAVGCRVALTWPSTTALLGAAVLALLPPVVTGHASVGAGHDLASNAAMAHVVASAVWLGTLTVLLVRRGPDLALRRYRVVAALCWAVLAASGVVQGLVLVAPADLTTTLYGRLLLVKVVLLDALGLLGVVLRRSATRPAHLAGIDLTLLAVSVGVSVGLVRQPPPEFFAHPATAMDSLIGYDLSTPFDPWSVRFDLVLGTAALVLAVGYLVGVRTVRRRGDTWPAGRTTAWLLGCAVLLLATSSAVGRYAPGVFSVHMVAHMALTMLAPVLLVLGGPVTLALRAVPTGEHGPREWLAALLHCRLARVLTTPAVACALFVGSYYALYLSPLFGAALPQHWAHVLMNTHFLLTGYLFYWTVIGVDPGPRRLPHLGRLGTLFAVMPFHAFFGVVLLSTHDVIGANFYRSLDLPWVPDLLADQHLGGGIAWASGEVPMLVVVIALLAQWSRADHREARRSDRHSDDDLAAYNAMLATLAETRR